MSDEKRELMQAEKTDAAHAAQAQRPNSAVAPRYEIVEEEHQFTIRLDMPGVNKDTLDVQVDRESLVVRGRRTESAAASAGTAEMRPILRERPQADYYREFSIDDTVDWEKTSASVSNGVAVIVMPKAKHAKPCRVKVE